MSKAQGNFDCAKLMTVQVLIQDEWAKARAISTENVDKIETLKVLLSKQTATFPELKDPAKEKKVNIVWIADCNSHEEQDCDDMCEVGGGTVESDCKEYELTKCIKDGFTVDEVTWRTSIFNREQIVAVNSLRMMKRMKERWLRLVLANLLSFKGVNSYGQDEAVHPAQLDGAGDTYIPPAYIDADLMLYLTEMAQMNNISDPFLLSGSLLNRLRLKYNFEKSNSQNGEANNAKFSSLPLYNDLWNIDTVMGGKGMMMIDPNAYAIVTKNRFPSTPEEFSNGADITRYSVQDPEIPSLYYDFVHNTECTATGIVWNWSAYLRYDVFKSPQGCDATSTGIYAIYCGEAA